MSIHPTAIVAEGAVVPASCTVGPYSTIGPNVVLGENNTLVSHVVLDGHTTLGNGNRIAPFACVGIPPQDLKYKGEPTRVVIGDNNDIRESANISRGTVGGGGLTQIGSGNLMMCFTHIGHDSIVGDHCIFANNATLAGHVLVEDFAVVGAFSAVHQFCKVGKYAYIGGGTMATQDVMPYSLTSASRENHAYSINKVGLERRGFTPEEIKQLRAAYRLINGSKLNMSDALAAIQQKVAAGEFGEKVAYLAEFIASSKRGVIK